MVLTIRGGSKISGKGVQMCKRGGGVRFAETNSIFLNIPENEKNWSH